MTILRDTTLGIDFGTSNSSLAVRHGQSPARVLAVEHGASALPTALFFNAETHQVHIGRDAINQYLTGTEGRLLRSLKSLLGSSLLTEKTLIQNSLISYQDIISLFLRRLTQSACAALGGMPERVVLGRPVHFVDDQPTRDQQAQDALAQAAQAAGLGQVAFQLEPIAAALDYEQRITRESLVLVVDIGGGTSDFTVVRLRPHRGGQPDRRADVLATCGVHIGGTDFDRRLSLARFMPLLGYGHHGPTGREVPNTVFFDLATWHLIQWRYTPRALRAAQDLRSEYAEQGLHRRLMTVLEQRLGHRLADVVEHAKITASTQNTPAFVPLDWIEHALATDLSPEHLSHHLADLLTHVMACALTCVRQAGLTAQDLDALYLTGGSSALSSLRAALQTTFVHTPQVLGDLISGVASGLALSSTD